MSRTCGSWTGRSGNRPASQAVSPARSIPGVLRSIPTRRYATAVGRARGREGGGRMARAQEPAVRRRLVEAAVRLFAEKGYENASVSEIVAAAGVTKGSMYHYFQAKDDLL